MGIRSGLCRAVYSDLYGASGEQTVSESDRTVDGWRTARKTGQELIRGLMQMVILGLGAGIAVLVGLLIDPDLVFPILLIYSLIVTTLVGLCGNPI